MRIEGLLLNAQMVNGIFDDLNPETRSLWDYPDGPWDPDRNICEFVAVMAEWREHGLLGFTINLQGGSPHGYNDGKQQPWIIETAWVILNHVVALACLLAIGLSTSPKPSL